MALTTDYKRLFVQCLKWDSEDASIDFIQQLKLACRAQYSLTKDGRLLVATLGNGRQVSFHNPTGDTRNLNPTFIAELLGEIISRYNQAQADLVDAGIATPTDAQIYAELWADLDAPILEAFQDFSEIRLPNNFTLIQDEGGV